MPKYLKKFFGEKQSLIAGALIISAGGFLSKLLGAAYRIPLTNILGGEGMGIYQMVYPLYCILLTVSASGIPAGIARLISSGKAEGAERTAFALYGAIGAIGSVAMYLLARPLAAAQGEPAVELCCKLLSPAVFFVALLSVVRGYYQGRDNMVPTAFTEVCEQLIKVLAGIALALTFRNDLTLAVASTLFAVTISELISSVFAVALYRGEWHSARRPLFRLSPVRTGQILRYTVPITFTAIAMPLSQLAESIVAVNLLREFTPEATALYGIFSGCAMTMINLPVSVTYGLAAASVPKISPLAASGKDSEAHALALRTLLITLGVAVPFAAGLFIFAPLSVTLIFRSLTEAQGALLIRLVRIMAVNAVTLSLVQTASACLTALGKPLRATVTQWAACILRVVLTAILIKFTSLSVSGAAVAANISFFVAAALNIWYIIPVGRSRRADVKAPQSQTACGGVYEDNAYRPRR